MEVRKLDSPVLLSYLQGRGINLELAKRECNEVHFENNGKRYFAIGFRNMAGGYEIRNRYFKGCIAPKDITHIRVRGIYGLSLVSEHTDGEVSQDAVSGLAGLYHIELDFQSPQGD